MIITVSGTPGSGKSTIAKRIASALGWKHFSAGDFMRQMAEEKGISLMELSKLAEKNISIDREIDARTVKLAAREDNFVMDSRLAFHFIPKALKIFVIVDPKVAAKRIFKDVSDNKRSVESELKSESDALKSVNDRLQSEVERYRKYYNIENFTDKKHYDFVFDTTNYNIEQCVEKVLAFVRSKM